MKEAGELVTDGRKKGYEESGAHKKSFRKKWTVFTLGIPWDLVPNTIVLSVF